MTDAEKIKLAKAATHHALNAICDDPRKFWLIGGPTGTWEKLTEAHAALFEIDVENVRAEFLARKEQYEAYCDEKEENDELLEYCRDHGITLAFLRENRISNREAMSS